MSNDPNPSGNIRAHFLLACVLAVTVGFLGSCGKSGETSGGTKEDTSLPKTGKIKVKPHDDINRNELYCKYKIKGELPKDAPLKVGDIFCILCPKDKQGCDDYSQVEEQDGKVYQVEALDKGHPCTTCPKGTDNPPGYPREP